MTHEVNTKHTPAQWDVTYATEYKTKVMAGDKVVTIARIGDGISTKEAEANARLIAAAPNLLAFAKLVAAGHLSREGFIDSAQRLLEKVEGKA